MLGFTGTKHPASVSTIQDHRKFTEVASGIKVETKNQIKNKVVIMLQGQPAARKHLISKDLGFFMAVFIPAMAIRCWFLLYLDEAVLFDKYPYFADKLAGGESLGNRLADLSPAYLYLSTAFRWLTAGEWGLFKFIQAVIGALNCWLTAVLGQRIFRNRALGFAAGAGLAAYGNLVILETTLEPTVFVIFFNLLAVLFLYRHVDSEQADEYRRTHLWLFLSALFTGISIITKPSFLLFIPLACLWLSVQPASGKSLAKTAATLMLFCVVALSIVFSITLRNYLLLDDVILVTADAGKVFFHGNSKDATVVEWAGLPDQGFVEENAKEPDYAHAAFRQAASKQASRELSPSESSKFWTQRTLEDIAAEPGRYFQRQWEKLLFFLSDYELHYIASAYKEYKASLGYPFIKISWIIAPAVIGMLLAAGQITRLLPLYGMILLYLASGLIFVVQSRYRIPAVPYFCLFAAFACLRLFQLLRSGRLFALGAVLGGVAIVYLLSNAFLTDKIQTIEKWYQATKIHYELEARTRFHTGQYAGAIEAASRALALESGFAPAYNLRGKSHSMLAEYRAAIEDFSMVIRLSPNHVEGYRNLGFVHLLNNDSGNAIIYIEKALSLNPGDKRLQNTLERLKKNQRPIK